MSGDTRPAAVAGTFYPGQADELAEDVQIFLGEAGKRQERESGDAPPPKALIVPHAGYVFSGAVAAKAYARLSPIAGRIKRVVLLGPAHRVFVQGVALPSVKQFETPLGNVPLDEKALRDVLDLPFAEISDAAHAEEHSLEVQLPFLQKIIGDFKLVPIVVGGAGGEQVAQLLAKLWGGDETLIVISSDLSHYHPYGEAQRRDTRTSQTIMAMQPDRLGPEDACGCRGINGLLHVARELNLQPTTLDLRNSGDTAGNKNRVVGYGAWTFAGDPDSTGIHLSKANKQKLLQLAAHGTRAAATGRPPPNIDLRVFGPALQRPAASFVTLSKNGRLRGCIGSLYAFRPLVIDVLERAFGAASKDSRFKPVDEAELPGLGVEVSVLSAPKAIQFADEDDLLAQLKPGQDGLILQDGPHRSTFLPKVWDNLGEKDVFMARLKEKAGLNPDYWSDSIKFWRYGTETFATRLPGRQPDMKSPA